MRGKKKVSDSPVVAVAKQIASLSPGERALAQEIAASLLAVKPKPAAAAPSSGGAEFSVGDVVHKAERKVRRKAKKVREKVVAAESKGSSLVKPAGGLTGLIGRGKKQAASGAE